MNLIAVGTVAFDSIETPFARREKVIGGAATYITLSASHFVKSSGLISVVGDDFPQEFLDTMTSRGIDQEGLQIKKGEKSFFWSGKYHYDLNSRDTLVTDLNVLADFNPIVPESYTECDFLMLGNLAPAVQMRVIEQLPVRPKLVVLDTMNFWMNVALEDLMKVIAKIDVLTINDEEARQLANEYSLVKAARKILKMGPKYLIIKKGEHGALLFDAHNVFFAPALPLEEVVDPTGAGDTFAGGFIGYLAQSQNISFENMKRAVIIGSAMASFTCEKFGPDRLLELTRDEINERVEQFVQLTDFEIYVED
ncbi:MAG: bifunctional hydroxymethylpyrimidine kinase/phosphomethylpyrimidine kinase [Flavobacteriales bacterium]|jgi:sugar/nucleoside kinase (ribokinase family)|nr:bifunctional hydroxymethylpyrimidine kinase/phosphomethylpyrimidine kinase [Flavobacteriales bacterium]MBX7051106.1 bifunctional hydroxymethylpyrimidine kinase/phosphomethylpyrimidine kinase [Flavobacteriales bacterium]